MKKNKIGFVTPGEILLEEFLEPLGISPNKLAIEIKVPATRIYAIIKGERAISADTDLRLSKYFGTSQGFWLGLQADHDLDVVKENIASDLQTIRKHEYTDQASGTA
ncbi:MAG: HigA family addiction module antidote protein [Nitrosopumilaceae archaeon]|nr:HigA family addiction module antidote protein [Nitrosopumilaceae archaeon]